MSLPRWWQAWKRPAAAASAAVVLSGLLATASLAQSPTATERNSTDREDRQERAGDPDRREGRRTAQNQRVRDEGEQRVEEERQAGQQAREQRNRAQQSSSNSQRNSGRDDDDDDRDQGQQNQGQHNQGQHNQGQHNQGQHNQNPPREQRFGQQPSQSQQRYGQSQQRGQQQAQQSQPQRNSSNRDRDYSYDRSTQRDSNQDQQRQHGLTWSHRNDGRLVVDSVESDSAWDRIGLMDGDRVVSINGRRVNSIQDFNRLYGSVQAGQRGAIVVYRDGDQETLYWTPRQSAQAQNSQDQQHGQAFLGVQLDDRYEDSAIVKAVYRGSPAEQAGLRAGDTIVALNGQEVSSPHDLTDIVGGLQPGEEVHLQIARRQNVNAQVRLGQRDSDSVRQASFQDRQRRDYSYDESNDDDRDRSSGRQDNQRDSSDDRRDDRNENDSNDSND